MGTTDTVQCITDQGESMVVVYAIIVTWVQGICLIHMPEAQGLRAHISGKL